MKALAKKSTANQRKSTFSRLQRCRWQCCDVLWNSSKIRTYSSSRSSKVIVLDVNRNAYATSY